MSLVWNAAARRVRLAALAVSLAACGPQSPPAGEPGAMPEQRFEKCAPCVVRIAPRLPEYTVFMDVVANAVDDSVVTALRVYAASDSARTAQRLPVSEDLFGGAVGQHLVAADLNRDGYADLGLSTGQEMVNSYFDYWLFDPGGKRFVPLGNYPSLERVGNTGELATFERDGCCTYARRRYRFTGGKLTLVRSDVSEPASSDTIVRVVEAREGNRMVPVCREAIVRRDPAREEPRDTVPAPTRCPAELAPGETSR
jgi:hypothetical protein